MKYNIKIYDQSMKELARLENAFDISYELKLNELWTCSFNLPKNDKKSIYCQPFNFVELFDGNDRIELFRILPSLLTRETTSYTEYECEHVLATLIDEVLFQYHQVGNLGYYTDRVIRYVLDHQSQPRWQLVECDFKRQFEYKWENENLLASLLAIPKVFNEEYRWIFDTTTKPWGISLKRLDTNYKADIQYKKNLQGIEKSIDPSRLVTRLYALGYGEGDNQLDIRSENNGVPYLEKNISKYGLKESILVDRRFENPKTLKEYATSVLDGLSEPYVSYKVKTVDLSVKDKKKYPKFWPGDYVLIRDVEDGLNHKFPIISVKKGDLRGNPFDIELEIANKGQDVTGSINDIMERARINDTYAQGATNLQQIAMADNADINKPLTFKFFIPLEMVRINKLILNYTIEAFRSYSTGLEYKSSQSSTSSGGGGNYTSTSTSYGGGSTSYGSTGAENWTMYGRGHNHGIPNGTNLFTNNNQYAGTFMESGDHTHQVSITTQSHSHSVSFSTNDHTHSFTIPGHTHEQKHGIYEGGTADYCTLVVDGVSVNIREQEVNIIPYLSKDDGGKIQRGTWHEVQIKPNKLTRINASIFIQQFNQSRGGGDF